MCMVCGFIRKPLVNILVILKIINLFCYPVTCQMIKISQLITCFLLDTAQIKLLTSIFLYSKFSDIYDEDHFIQRLKNDVRVVDKVPEFIMERFGHNLSNAFNFKIKAWSPIQFYEDIVLPKLIEERLVEANTDLQF